MENHTVNKGIILSTEESDLNFIYQLFDDAISYQQKKKFPVWPGYDKEVLLNDIAQKLQFKLVQQKEITYIFSICYADKIIWRDKDKGDAVYLHRMVVNPKFKGEKRFSTILEWTKKHAKDRHLRYVRMDTWADNPNLIAYYTSFGFQVTGYFTTPDTNELPIQQRNNKIVLLELDLLSS